MISVIIPTYNHTNYLPRALKSIFCQTISDFEVIIVDDGNTDGTLQLVKTITDHRIHYYYHAKKLGPICAFNTGLANCHGEYICQIDADDYLPRDSFEKRLSALIKSKAEVLHAGLTRIDLDGSLVYYPPLPQNKLNDFLQGKNRGYGINHVTFLYCREALARLGPKSEDLRIFPNEDYEYALRTLLSCRMEYVDSNTYFYEIHPSSHSSTSVSGAISQRRRRLLERRYLKLLEHCPSQIDFIRTD